MSIIQDSNSPYATAFNLQAAGEAAYMTAEDTVLGKVLAVVYRADVSSKALSVVLIGNHGTSGYVDITLGSTSRYYGACASLAFAHQKSQVRKALAIAVLRTYSTMDRPLRRALFRRAASELKIKGELPLKYYDQTAAGALGSKFRLVYGKFPLEIGRRVIESGMILPKFIRSSVLDIVYEDTDLTIDQNNDLVYMLGDQLEQLFDPLSEYSPEPTERIYVPPADSIATLEDDPKEVQDICEELYMLQSSVRASLIDFLQNFLIPLRVRVLNHEIPGMTIGKLNTVFPPTIDEMFRINNIFYEALQQALPFGSFEVLKACGTTIPYFYRVCIRHEAATKNFARSLATTDSELKHEIDKYSPQKIEAVMQNSLHLVRLKLVLDRFMETKKWSPSEKALADEFYHVSTGTIDQFGKETQTGAPGKRVFTPSGKMLVEIASGWPAELEYGWINRRVVTIFDAVDIIEPSSARRQLHNIVIMFTDALVILEPAEPIPMTSLSGLHLPSIGDVLMHAMLNEAPLDGNLPPLKVIGWAPILDVSFLSFGPKSLVISTQPEPFACKFDEDGAKHYTKIYRLIRPDHTADKFVELLAKAKVTTKTQPFHLFKISSLPTQGEVGKNVPTDLSIYSTVHELQGYHAEVNRSPIAVFLNTQFGTSDLATNDLCGAVCINFKSDMAQIEIKVVSLMGYTSFKEVSKEQFKEYVVSEITYLATLVLSSQNPAAIQGIISTNRDVTANMIRWASQPPDKVQWHHRRSMFGSRPNLNNVLQPVSNGTNALPTLKENTRNTWTAVDSPKVDQTRSNKPRASFMPAKSSVPANIPRTPTAPDISATTSVSSTNVQNTKKLTSVISGKAQPIIIPELPLPKTVQTNDNSPNSFHTAGGSPGFGSAKAHGQPDTRGTEAPAGNSAPVLRKKANFEGTIPKDRSTRDLAQKPSLPSIAPSQDSIGYKFPRTNTDNGSSWDDFSTGLGSTEVSSTEEAEQRDVDAWFEGLEQRDADSLSTSDIGDTSSMYEGTKPTLDREDSARSIRLSAFLDRSSSVLYNRYSGAAFPALLDDDDDNASHLRNISLDSVGSTQSAISARTNGTSDTEQDDFSYLADLVQDEEVMSNSSSAGRLYPDLRELSLVRLGSYVLKNDKSLEAISQQKQEQGSSWSLPGLSEEPDFYGSDEPTPTLGSTRRVNDDEVDVEVMLGSVNQWLEDENAKEGATPVLPGGETPVLTLDRPPRLMMPENSSHTINSFRRMVMSSSLNTLQLASLTIQIDQFASNAPAEYKKELQRIKEALTDMYNQTQHYSEHYTPAKAAELRFLAPREDRLRRHLILCIHSLLSMGYPQLVSGVLEMEWIRRSKLHEGLGEDMPLSLWHT
ncbi:Bud site selection protein 3 [Wickerhamiella sorbophila]|uniref:Bud site selection protein 3 n=1 Tax=Wickerhamiella sorbophila TaxID=45607 RepID=A0A2T0FJ30_9ASCO|nr:Bud site selection protein 3 [Wickerhamiella sorbophila]PRT55013.1 Bud site selection protein 3 [Wickerhamiella sorbophila]